MKDLIITKLNETLVEQVYNLEKDLIGNVDKNSIINSLKSNTLSYYVLCNQKEVIGFFECSVIPPEAELYDIVINANYQGNGYSKVLMDYFIKVIKENNCNTIFLEVNKLNYKAINLYKKYGFIEYSVRKNYYGDSDAVLMKKEL